MNIWSEEGEEMGTKVRSYRVDLGMGKIRRKIDGGIEREKKSVSNGTHSIMCK